MRDSVDTRTCYWWEKNEMVIDIRLLTEEQKKSLYHNLALWVDGMPETVNTIDEAIAYFAKSDETVEYWYYINNESGHEVMTLNPILLFANFFDVMCEGKFDSWDEMRVEMMREGCYGGDFLTEGSTKYLKIRLSNGGYVRLKNSYKSVME